MSSLSGCSRLAMVVREYFRVDEMSRRNGSMKSLYSWLFFPSAFPRGVNLCHFCAGGAEIYTKNGANFHSGIIHKWRHFKRKSQGFSDTKTLWVLSNVQFEKEKIQWINKALLQEYKDEMKSYEDYRSFWHELKICHFKHIFEVVLSHWERESCSCQLKGKIIGKTVQRNVYKNCLVVH